MAKRWYVAMTRPGAGKLAELCLLRQDFEVFNPKIRIRHVSRGREWFSERHYLPGYLFIAFDVEADEWRPINWTWGIRHLISAVPERPTPMRDVAMRVLLDRCDGNGYVLEEEADQALEWLRVGRQVKITQGAMAGCNGVVKWKDGDRLKVLLSFLGSTRPVEVRAKSLEAVV